MQDYKLSRLLFQVVLWTVLPVHFRWTSCVCQHPHHPPAGNCTSNSCSGNGTCYEAASSETKLFCDCHPGFYGPKCNFDVDVCADVDEPILCSGNGHCIVGSVNDQATPVCVCTKFFFSSGFLGKFCDLKEPEYKCVRPLCVNGECTLQGECYCDPGRLLWGGAIVYLHSANQSKLANRP